MTVPRLTTVVALATVALSTAVVHAQYGGGYGSGYGGGYGNQGGGFGAGFGQQGGGFGGGQGSGFGGGFGQQSGFGSSPFGNTGGGFGQQGGGFGQGGFGQQGGFGGQQGGFGRGNQFGGGAGGQGGQRNFVGRDSREVQNTFQTQFGQANPGLFGGAAIQNFNDQRESRRRWRDQQNAPPPIRVQLRPAADLIPAPQSLSELEAGVQARLAGSFESRGIRGAQVAMTPQGAVLTGVVPTERDKALIAQLLALEPGVGAIDNRLTVASPDVASPASSTSPELRAATSSQP
jgi:hypothetical protein